MTETKSKIITIVERLSNSKAELVFAFARFIESNIYEEIEPDDFDKFLLNNAQTHSDEESVDFETALTELGLKL